MRALIINADGFGMTAGINWGIEECIAAGTVRSLSANVNLAHANALTRLVQRFPELSVGCHINPVVGPPVLPPQKVPSLLGPDGLFWYRRFMSRFLLGKIRLDELRAEMMAQVEKTRALAGDAFSHVDFHMGLHRLPRLYDLFLQVAQGSATGRIRTHRYRMGMESSRPGLHHVLQMLQGPTRLPKFAMNSWMRRKALARGLAMPDCRVAIRDLGFRANTITLQNYQMLLQNVPEGISELTVHPGYVDDELPRWTRYISSRELELGVLASSEFRSALQNSDVRLAGFRDIPTRASALPVAA